MKNLWISAWMLIIGFGSIGAQQHSNWTLLLQKNVDDTGRVDYNGLQKEKALLNEYLKQLKETHPENMPKKAALAFWINVYNAFTIQLILDHYPVKSIKDIKVDGKEAWSIPFIQIHGKNYTLDQIQKEKLAAFRDPRIHFAINCAAKSCPPLANTAFEAVNLESVLEARTQLFINNPSYNKFDTNQLQLSMIFQWYANEFEQNSGSVKSFLQRYIPYPISSKANIKYIDYNWDLNQK